MTQSAMKRTVAASFKSLDDHDSLVVQWKPMSRPRAVVLFLPPFGDEMNQTRRMFRLTAEALAERGIEGCLFDLFGTGDSSADFVDASVERWLADCRTMAAELVAEARAPLIMIGCRLGLALGVQLSHSFDEPAAGLIGWAPVMQGRAQLSGLLRLASMAKLQRSEKSVADPRSCWAAGRPAELGGYPISPQLAQQLEILGTDRAPCVSKAALIDVRLPVDDSPVLPSAILSRQVSNWAGQGVPTQALAVSGPAFWNVSELVDIPQLVDLSVRTVENMIGPMVAA